MSMCAATSQGDRQEKEQWPREGKMGPSKLGKRTFGDHTLLFFPPSLEIFCFKHHKKVLDISAKMPRRASRRRARLHHGPVDN